MPANQSKPTNCVCLKENTGGELERKVARLDTLFTDELRDLIRQLDGQRIELDRKNRLLQADLGRYRTSLHRLEMQNDQLPIGVLILDSNNLITAVNKTAAEMLGPDPAQLNGKPITLYLAPQDQGPFFLNRNKILSSQNRQSLQANFIRPDRSTFPVHIECVPAPDFEPSAPGLVLFARDISEEIRLKADLNCFSEMTREVRSISHRLITAPVSDIDEAIKWALAKIGKMLDGDRVFMFRFNSRNATISNCHEWCSRGIESQRHLLIDRPKARFAYIVNSIEQLDTVYVKDVDQLPMEVKFELEECCMTRVRSVVCVPMLYGKSLSGFLGCASGRSGMTWTVEKIELMKLVGEFILNARMRKPAAGRLTEQPERCVRVAKSMKKTKEPIRRERVGAVPADVHQLPESIEVMEESIARCDGPIQILDEIVSAEPAEATVRCESWGFMKVRHPDPSGFRKVFAAANRPFTVTCPVCSREGRVQVSDIPGEGNILTAICPCGLKNHLLLEFRKEARKQVEIRGIFMKVEPDENSYHFQDQWGSIQIHNISKSGIGFVAYGDHAIQVNDQFSIKFTLDNELRSVIRKQVVVRVVKNNYIGCEFVESDKYDSTLGFYLLGNGVEEPG